MGRIVVGVDGSDSSRAALRWAVDEAKLRDDTVEAVIAWHEPYVGGPFAAPVTTDPKPIEESARAQLDRVVDRVDASGLGQPIERIVTAGGAARTLIDTAKGADLLVVGTRGHGGFVGLLLGSVSHHVVSHAPCPVVVVPKEASLAADGDRGRIAVGVDGSEGSLAALQWALDEAAVRGVDVTAVIAWLEPYATAEVMAPMITEDALRDGARESLDGVIAAAEIPAGVAVHREVVRGHPVRALFDATAGADELVVGSRGHGGFVGLLLGSVSHQVVAHAPRPVVVVPHPDDHVV